MAGPIGGGCQSWGIWFAEAEPMRAAGSETAPLWVQVLSRGPS